MNESKKNKRKRKLKNEARERILIRLVLLNINCVVVVEELESIVNLDSLFHVIISGSFGVLVLVLQANKGFGMLGARMLDFTTSIQAKVP